MYNLVIKDKIMLIDEDSGELIEQYDYNENAINGNIYMAKVKRVVKGLDSSFLDIGEGKNALLRNTNYSVNSNVIVQVKKEPTETKGAIVTDKIQIPGKYIILLPTENYITVSSKINDEKEINRLKELVKSNIDGYGVIVRTSAKNEEEKIVNEIKQLIDKWKWISSNILNVPQLLYKENIIKKVLLGLNDKNISKIITYKVELVKHILNELGLNIPIEEKEIYIKTLDIYKRTVWLKSGASIKIDITEALIAIDVNSGSFIGRNDFETTAETINREATIEIAKQIRLRNLRGIIIIDYINLKSEIAQKEIIDLMKQEIKKDRSKVEVFGFTKLGLLEMTRKEI